MKIVSMAEYARQKRELSKAHKDKLPGGLADKKKPDDFDRSDLADGIAVEREHTKDDALAREIAMDHLTEDKDYYRKLARVESGMHGKASGPYYGPRGGKYADPQHKTPWRPAKKPQKPQSVFSPEMHAQAKHALSTQALQEIGDAVVARLGDRPPAGKKIEVVLKLSTGWHIVEVRAEDSPGRATSSRSADGKGGYIRLSVPAGKKSAHYEFSLRGALAHEAAHAADPNLAAGTNTSVLHDEEHAKHPAERPALFAEAVWHIDQTLDHGRELMRTGLPWEKPPKPLSAEEAAVALVDDVPNRRPLDQSGALNEAVAYARKRLETMGKSERFTLRKAGQMYIGPRGGKWANPQHTIPYKEPTRRPRKHAIPAEREREALMRKIKRRPPGEGAEVELNHQELRMILNTGKFALVSAGPNPEFPEHKGMSAEEAAKRHGELKKKLVAAGFMHTKVTGHYGGKEDSFLVMIHDAERGSVRQLGEIFKQDSVIYAEAGRNEMHYTYGPKHEKGLCVEGKSWSEKPTAQDYYSVVRHPNGTRTKFALNFNWGSEKPCKKGMVHTLSKAGPYIGPRGGKWADPQHTVPWHEAKPEALAAMSKDDFRRHVQKHGIDLRMHRGTRGPEDPGTQWFASRKETAAGYAKGGTVRSQQVKMSRPYIASTTEIINASSGMIDRLKKEGYDGIVAQWSGGIATRSNPHPKKEIWAVVFPRTLSKAYINPRKLADRYTFQGMNISIENAKGQKRKWYDKHAQREGETTMLYDYGYIRGTLGTDGDHVDVYVGPNENAENVYIINQLKAPDFTKFDEQKCMLGFDSDTEAKAAYLAHFDSPRFFGSMEVMEISKFRDRVLRKDNHGQPIEKSMKPPKGYTKAPGSKKGGYRKRVAGGWHYWYPGQPHPGKPSEPVSRPKPKKKPFDPTKPPADVVGAVRAAEEGTAVVFKDSKTDKAERPGIWKMENGAFHLKRSRTYEIAADGKHIRKTELVPSVDEQTKLQLIQEFTPLIRKASRDAQRQFALKSRFEMGMGGVSNDVQTELQRGGIEGLLNAVRTYRGKTPFASHAQSYVKFYVTAEARQQRGGTDLPELHHKNLRKFIGAKVKAQVRFKTDNPTPEQIAKYFDLRLKHVHKGAPPGKRNELVPMEPYKLALGRKGAAPEVHVRGKGKMQVKQMRDVVEQRSRVQWAEMYDAYLKGDKSQLSFDAQGQQIFAELFAGRGLDTDDQVAVRNQINFAMQKMKGLGEVTIEGPAPGRPRGGKQPMTQYSVVDIAEVLKRRLGLEGHDEHSINELAEVIPVYRQKADGDWQEVSERSARAHLQHFIDVGMDKLKAAVQDRGHAVRGVVDRAAAVVAPKERMPQGPTYHEKMKMMADAMTPSQIEDYRQKQIAKLSGAQLDADVVKRSVARLRGMTNDQLAMAAAKASVEGQRLSAEMRKAMTRFIDVERIGAHEGVAYMRDPATGAYQSVRVRMGYDRSYDPTTPAGQPLMKKAFELLTDSILREIMKWPETMALLVAEGEPTYQRQNLELMAL